MSCVGISSYIYAPQILCMYVMYICVRCTYVDVLWNSIDIYTYSTCVYTCIYVYLFAYILYICIYTCMYRTYVHWRIRKCTCIGYVYMQYMHYITDCCGYDLNAGSASSVLQLPGNKTSSSFIGTRYGSQTSFKFSHWLRYYIPYTYICIYLYMYSIYYIHFKYYTIYHIPKAPSI